MSEASNHEKRIIEILNKATSDAYALGQENPKSYGLVGEALLRLCALYEDEAMPGVGFSRPAWLANAVNMVLNQK